MRIWDVHPGYLSRQGLVGEHAELHGLVAILRAGRQRPGAKAARGAGRRRRTYARLLVGHPEARRWQGFGWALAQRHRLLVAEMALRGIGHQSAVALRTAPGAWPTAFLDAPAEQFRMLAAKYAEALATTGGRIPLPRSAQELWAQHKYSVLARDQAAYRTLGPRVSGLRGQQGMVELAHELTAWLRRPPTAGNTRNAVEHMWGYVDAAAVRPLRALRTGTALRTVARLAAAQGVAYLLGQTALTELVAWPVERLE